MKYAYWPKLSVLIVAWVIVLCLILSAAFSAVSEFILRRNAAAVPEKPVKTERERTLQKV